MNRWIGEKDDFRRVRCSTHDFCSHVSRRVRFRVQGRPVFPMSTAAKPLSTLEWMVTMLWVQLQAESRMQSNTDKLCNSLHRSSEYLAKSQPRTSPCRTRWPLGHRSEETCALHNQQWRHLEKPTAIASRKCCLSSTRQIKTSFLLHWHSSYHCSKNIYSHPTVTVGPGSNCLPTLIS